MKLAKYAEACCQLAEAARAADTLLKLGLIDQGAKKALLRKFIDERPDFAAQAQANLDRWNSA